MFSRNWILGYGHLSGLLFEKWFASCLQKNLISKNMFVSANCLFVVAMSRRKMVVTLFRVYYSSVSAGVESAKMIADVVIWNCI